MSGATKGEARGAAVASAPAAGGTDRPLPTVAVAGAGGYVGRRLTEHLSSLGYPVVVLGRHRATLPGGPGIEQREVDAADPSAGAEALEGTTVAYYLLHAMAGGPGFATRDRTLARSFADAAAAAGTERIVYLGGLGSGDLSEHLASRHEVGRLLGGTGIPVVELRAAVVLGAGSISFEMLRYLTERLPAMVCPRWIDTRLQPIAEQDLLAYLHQSLEVAPGTYEIGSPDTTTYGEMIAHYATVRRLRRRLIVKVPFLTPSLSAHWVDLVSPVDRDVSHALIESLTSEVIVTRGEETGRQFTVDPLPVAEAIAQALADQAARVPPALFDRRNGLSEGIHTMRSKAALPTGPADLADLAAADLGDCGGDLAWYGTATAWQLRRLLGRLFGERMPLRRPATLAKGSQVDWWTVEQYDRTSLVLGTTDWFFGDAWLGYRVVGSPGRVEQVGALRPRGVPGFLYWRVLEPVHAVVFRLMARHRVSRARAQAVRRHEGPIGGTGGH